GEERVPTSLAKLERLHNRVVEWVPAQPASVEDVIELSKSNYPDLEIGEDLLEDLCRSTRGCLRRVAVNLYKVQCEASANMWDRVDLA
ncbi:DNA transposition protein, partial [Pseudomonas sp. FW305-BF6]